jgi:glycosyltransferase involved in cell wall biosynthesis
MKILHIINSLQTGGAEKLVISLCSQLQKENLNVDVVVLKKTTPIFDLSELNVTFLGNTSVYNPIYIIKLFRLINSYDLIHVHLFPAFYFTVLAKWICFSKTKIIYTEHNTHNRRRNQFLFKLIDRLFYRGIYHVVCITEKVYQNLKNHLSSKFNYSIIHNGVDVLAIEQSMPYSDLEFFESKSKIIIQVSSFRPQKDQITLIKALAFLPDNFKLLLVGDGRLKDNCLALTQDLKLNDRVKFLGNRSDVYSLLKTANYVVLSSHYEGLSLASIEGMASNRPFIASNVDGLSDIVDGYGLLFEKGNSEELAKLILELENDPVLYSKIADRCFKRALSFDLSLMVQSHIKLYNKLLNA